MRRMTLVVALAAVLGSTSVAKADLEAGFTSGLFSNYVFRGARVASVGLTTDAYATWSLSSRLSVTGSIWNYTTFNNQAGAIDWVELDYTASATYVPTSWMALTAGYTYYDMNRHGGFGVDTQEAWGGVDFNWWGSPYVYAYYDFDNAVGTYLEAGISKSYSVGRGWSADCAASVGFDFGRLDRDGGPNNVDGLSHGLVSTQLWYELEPGLNFGPALDLWFPSTQIDPGAKSFRPVASLNFSYSKGF